MRGEHHHRGVRHCVGIEQKTPLAMITDLTKPVDVFLEYHEDLEKLMYWKEKHKKAMDKDIFQRLLSADARDGNVSSTPIRYHSRNDNDWLLWFVGHHGKYGGFPEVFNHRACYRLLHKYMTVCTDTSMVTNKGETAEGVIMFKDHLFMRMAERLGITIDDRISFIQNFIDTVANCTFDVRKPRKGERHWQALARLPGSWLLGHIVFYNEGKYFVATFRTYYTDMTLSAKQRASLREFAAFADQVKDEDDFRKITTEQRKQKDEKTNNNNR